MTKEEKLGKNSEVQSFIYFGSNCEISYAAAKKFAENAGISEFDTYEIEPEENGKNSKGEIGVKMIRELTRQMNLTPGHGGGKLAIIREADKLGLEAANPLLKTLEEPPKHATLILLSADLQLLPTIRSRCQIVRFEDALSSGDEEILAEFRQSLLGNLKTVFKSAEKMSNEDDLERRLDIIISSIRNQLPADPNTNKVKVIKLILSAKKNLKATTNKRLVVENLLMNIKYGYTKSS